jgi:hypothetical protein
LTRSIQFGTVRTIRITEEQLSITDSYETREIELDGMRYRGRYRVMAGSVIVYYESEIEFAEHGMTDPEVVVKWLLSDLSRRAERKKRKTGKTSADFEPPGRAALRLFCRAQYLAHCSCDDPSGHGDTRRLR